MSMYYPPLRSDEIYHWGFKKGEESKDHKYYARVQTGTKNGQNVYRYFYTKDEYFAYTNGKIVNSKPIQDSIKNTESQNVNSAGSLLSRVLFGVLGSKIIEAGKQIVESLIGPSKEEKEAQERERQERERAEQEQREQDYQKYLEEQEKRAEERRKQMTEAEKKKNDDWQKAADENGGKKDPQGDEQHKYVGKVLMPDGTYRYFYDQKSLQSFYTEVNDPLSKEFNIKPSPSSEEEDMAEINERYPLGDEYQNNCYSCTIAYDMRRRGYDVEAIPDSDGETWENILSCYDNPTKKQYKASMDSRSATQFMMSDMLQEGEGARGNICVYWKYGGGHSMAWEVTNGEVIIRDNQTNEVYSGQQIYNLMEYVDTWDAEYYALYNLAPINWLRTDNANINTKNVTKYVRSN